MAAQLVIVDSEAKAKALAHQLGRDHLVRAAPGLLHELPKRRLGVDPARGFAVEYELSPVRRRQLAELREAVRGVDAVTLAAEPDAEGEASCFSLAEALAGPRRRFARVELRELTAGGIGSALRSAREIDARRVDAQLARRVLDRLVAYHLGPLLGETAPAARLALAALHLLCERERVLHAFVPERRWAIRTRFQAEGPCLFAAELAGARGKDALVGAEAAGRLVRALQAARFRVVSVVSRPRRRRPPPPFTTASLLQEALHSLGFAVRKTMQLAQGLYEGVDLGDAGVLGLITYVRTDSTRVAPGAARAAREQAERLFGCRPSAAEHETAAWSPEQPEAIRPCDAARAPGSLPGRLGRDALALYALVYQRFLASQMAHAVYDSTEVAIEGLAGEPRPPWRLLARDERLRDPGFLVALGPASDPARQGRPGAFDALPPLAPGQPLVAVATESLESISEPPRRYDEADLVEALESAGIGRPSTYAPILAALRAHAWVERRKREPGPLVPTPLGLAVHDQLVRRLPELTSTADLAALEAQLDAIEDGRATRLGTLGEFWARCAPALLAARQAPTPIADPEAAAGRRGQAGGGPVAPRATPPAGPRCPRCHEGRVVERQGADHRFFGCSRYPSCRFTSNERPLAESCPECGAPCLFEKETPRAGRIAVCRSGSCRYRRSA